MATLSNELELLGKHGTTDGMAAFANKLGEIYLEVKAALEERLEKHHREGQTKRGRSPVTDTLGIEPESVA